MVRKFKEFVISKKYMYLVSQRFQIFAIRNQIFGFSRILKYLEDLDAQ